MPKACSAINCPNRDTRENRADGLSFHSFPKAHALRKKWMLAVNRIEPGSQKLWIPGAGACLCSEHFRPAEFELYGGQRRLKAGVVPSRFSFQEPAKRQHPSKSLKAMGINRPATSLSEPASAANPLPAQAKTVELIQAEHQYSLSEPAGDGTKPFSPLGLVLGGEREQDVAQRRLSYYQQELWSVLESLREQHLLQEDTEGMLKSQFADLQLSLQCEGVRCETYPSPARNFAVSLHLFSAKAYEFMKRTFQLPESATLHTWLSNSDDKPGFSQQAFDALAKRSQAGEQDFKRCSLLVGAMPLERRLYYDPSTRRLQGFMNFGAGNYDADEVLSAGEALLLVAVGFQGQWVVPVGYFFLATLRGDVQAQLLRHCVLKLYDAEVQVVSVTSDATAPSIDMARRLGVGVDGLAIKSTFSHPATPTLEIAYFFDPGHLLSLIHNWLRADGGLLVSGKAVRWDYLLHLGALQEEEVLQALRRSGEMGPREQRVWGNGATQVFSEGTVQALRFAAGLGLPQFQGHETTAHFIGVLSAVFDVCSRRKASGQRFRAPLSLAGADTLGNLCNEYENLLRKLHTAAGELLWLSRHRWGFLGFLVNLRSCQRLVQTRLRAENSHIPHLLPGWWSLDPLEWCRGSLRQVCRCQGLATAGSFQQAYRVVLSRAVSGLGLDPPNLLDISLRRRASLQLQASWPARQGTIWQLPLPLRLSPRTSRVSVAPGLLAELEDAVTDISCAVLETLWPLLPCAECRAALLHPLREVPAGCALTCVETKGGRYLPAKSVQRVVRRAKQAVVGLSARFSGSTLAQELAILADVSEEPCLFPDLTAHLSDSNTVVCNHYVTLLQALVQTFLGVWFKQVQGPQPIRRTRKCHPLEETGHEQSTEDGNGSRRSQRQQAREVMEWYKML